MNNEPEWPYLSDTWMISEPINRMRALCIAAFHNWQQEQAAETCVWIYNEDEGCWDAACERKWVYTDSGTPQEHGDTYCGKCGKRIEVKEVADGD